MGLYQDPLNFGELSYKLKRTAIKDPTPLTLNPNPVSLGASFPAGEEGDDKPEVDGTAEEADAEDGAEEKKASWSEGFGGVFRVYRV